MQSVNYLPEVQKQYEDFPYPYRNPEDEKKRLLTTGDYLGWINHYCYSGRQTFEQCYRVLVAGGGTGDGIIFLAEQLRSYQGAKLVYIDLSSSSMAVARKRAEVRGLNNIEWHQMSLLDVPALCQTFDYINCTGVLHHLEDPQAGLKALSSILADDGAMRIMVYARYGRAAVYQMQELMRLINAGIEDKQIKIKNAKKVMDILPAANLFRQQMNSFNKEFIKHGDAGIYDMLLHSTDFAYTVPQLYDLVANAGLHLVIFVAGIGNGLNYMATPFFSSAPDIAAHVQKLPMIKQQAIAELLQGNIKKHSFFVTKLTGTTASLNDLENIPYFAIRQLSGPALAAQMLQNQGQPLTIKPTSNIHLTIKQGQYTINILEHLDGETCLADIFEKVRRERGMLSDAQLLEDFRPLYEQLEMLNLLLLRHKSVKAF